MTNTPIRVTDDSGNVFWVDPSALMDPAMPTDDNQIALTSDMQGFQYTGGLWFRVLRCDQVTWNANIKPNFRAMRQMPFALGRAQGY